VTINWADFGKVFVATIVSAVAIVVLFSFGVIGLSRQADAKAHDGSGVVPLTGAIVCFGLCMAIVGYGIYLIVAH
jgi:hypothetical protein